MPKLTKSGPALSSGLLLAVAQGSIGSPPPGENEVSKNSGLKRS
jgi:hypothetical protein